MSAVAERTGNQAQELVYLIWGYEVESQWVDAIFRNLEDAMGWVSEMAKARDGEIIWEECRGRQWIPHWTEAGRKRKRIPMAEASFTMQIEAMELH